MTLSQVLSDSLHPSTRDTIELSNAVQERFVSLCGAYLRLNQKQLVPPEEVRKDVLRWRTMVVRWRKGEVRNSRSELLALRNVAEWSHRTNCVLRRQPIEAIVWKD